MADTKQSAAVSPPTPAPSPVPAAPVATVEQLTKHLAESGTGKAKIDAILTMSARAGFKTVTADCLTAIKKITPSGTFEKVTKFLDSVKAK